MGSLNNVIYYIIAIMFGPAILLAIIGLVIRKKHNRASKVLFILAALYLIVGLGICSSM
jgi:uncharacterized membrane protein YhaH (DUF805 family)